LFFFFYFLSKKKMRAAAVQCASLLVWSFGSLFVEAGTMCSTQTGPTSFEDVDCGEADCLVAQYELLFDNSARCTPMGCNTGADGMVMSTAGTNVIYKLCTSEGGDAVCNAGVDMYEDCAGGEFTLREGSPTFVYDDGTNPGGGAPMDGGGGSDAATDVEDETAAEVVVPDYPRCEAFDPSNEEVADCAPFIGEGVMVYVPAGESQGDLLSKNLGLNQILDSLPFMNPTCQTTFGSYWCQSRMRPCETVTTADGKTSFPAAQMICLADCEAHAADCLADYEAVFPESYLGGIAVARGSTVTAPLCNRLIEGSDTNNDPEMTWFMYRHGGEVTYEGNFPLLTSTVNPRIPAGQDLYPAKHTIYDDGSDNGYAVSCKSLSAGTGISVSCPGPLVVNPDLGAGEDLCALPCPSFIYTNSEYLVIMLMLSVPGILGVGGNFYMVVAHAFAKKAFRKDITIEVKWAAFIGMWWGIISPLPSAILFTDVACADECLTENCASKGIMCALNRNSVFLLQCIQWLFTSVVVALHVNASSRGNPSVQQIMLKKVLFYMSFGIPFVCMVLSNVLHTDDMDAPNAAVNSIRDNFSCHPHLANSGIEFMLIYFPFLVGGAITMNSVVCVILILKKAEQSVANSRKKSEAALKVAPPPQNSVAPTSDRITSNKKKKKKEGGGAARKARRKLMIAGALVSVLLVTNTVGTMLTLPTLADFGTQEELWFECVKNNAISQSKEVGFDPAMMNCFEDKCPSLLPQFDFACSATLAECAQGGTTSDFKGFYKWYNDEGRIARDVGDGKGTPDLVGTVINGEADLLRLDICDGVEGSPTCNWDNFMCFVDGCRLNDPSEQLTYFSSLEACPSKPDLRPSPHILALNAFAHSCSALIIFFTFGTHEKYVQIWKGLFSRFVLQDKNAVAKDSDGTAVMSSGMSSGSSTESNSSSDSGSGNYYD
jgi:hypothetical protein